MLIRLVDPSFKKEACRVSLWFACVRCLSSSPSSPRSGAPSCAVRAGLVRGDTPLEVGKAIERRIFIAQSLHAFGALLCVISTYWSIAFIMLVQLNYAIAPRIRPLTRL